MKKSNKIAILLLVLVSLVGGYVLLEKMGKDKTADSTYNDNQVAPNESIELIKFDPINLTEIDIESNGENIAFARVMGKWFSKQDSLIRLDSQLLEAVAKNISELNSNRIVDENGKNLDAFGLDSPKIKAEFKLQDGTTETLYIGYETPDKEEYYVMVGKDKTVYTTSVYQIRYLGYGLDEFKDKVLPFIDTDTASYLKIKSEDQFIEIEKNNEKWEFNSPYPSEYNVSSYDVGKVLENITSMTISHFIETDVKDFSKYGLDNPKMEIRVKDTSGNSLNLFFGNDVDDKEIYFTMENYPEVYSMAKSKLEYMKNLNPFLLYDKSLVSESIENVNSIIINNENEDYKLFIDSKDENKPVYAINDKPVDKNKFKSIYDKLKELSVEGEADKQAEGKQAASITLLKKDDTKITISFYEYDRDFYTVYIDKDAQFLISKSQLDNVIKEIDNLIKEIEK